MIEKDKKKKIVPLIKCYHYKKQTKNKENPTNKNKLVNMELENMLIAAAKNMKRAIEFPPQL